MQTFMGYTRKLKAYALAHKTASIISIVVVIGVSYYFYASSSSTTETKYILGTAERGNIISSITGTGQVAASNQVDLKPKASGDVVYIGVKNGEQVKAGRLIMSLDDSSAQKAVRDAEANLQSAQISYDKLVQPADALSMLQGENAFAQASTSLAKSYDDGYGAVSDAFLDLPNVMAGLQAVLYDQTVSAGQDNISAYSDFVKNYDDNAIVFKNDAAAKYIAARAAYDKNFLDYRSSSRVSDKVAIQNLVSETYATSRTVSDAVKSANDLINFSKDTLIKNNQHVPSIYTTNLNTLNTYTGQVNSHVQGLLSSINTITTAEYSYKEKDESLRSLRAGADVLDIQSSKLSITQRQNALQDAKENLGDYYVRAPFDGTVASLNVKKGDAVSSGTSVATFITKQKIAEISLNEVDVTKIQTADKVTLTFDAIEELSITGEVLEIDTVGTVSQGVVTYAVKIGFDTDDERVKPGMSVNAAIITDVKQDVLVVPNSAIKTTGGVSYVQVLDETYSAAEAAAGVVSATVPRQVPVEIGVSNDTSTEILSGILAGQQVITRIISGTTAPAAQTAPSLFGGGARTSSSGGTRTGGNAVFIGR